MSEPTPKEGFRVVRLPFFPGFYESDLSRAMNSHEEREAEYMAEKEIPTLREEREALVLSSEPEEPHDWQPEHLRITASEYCELFFDCCDYGAVYEKVAHFWVEAFDLWCKNNLGTPEGSFTFEAMVSPREYNFTTDVVYAYVPEAVIRSLFEKSKADEHKQLEKVIKASFTSYDGFISFYPNDLEAWLEKPLSEWDYNELGTLLGAVMQLCEDFEDNDKFRDQLYEYIFSGNGEEDEAWDAGMDWPKFEEKVKELRAEKAAEHEEAAK
jgi:hypothetical protein